MTPDVSNQPRDITEHIKNFREFLNASEPFVDLLMNNHDWDEDATLSIDWLEENWKLLVERELLQGDATITPFLGASLSLVGSKDFAVVVASSNNLFDVQNNQMVPFDKYKYLRFGGLSTKIPGGYSIGIPYDLAHLIVDEKRDDFRVPFGSLRFYLIPFSEYLTLQKIDKFNSQMQSDSSHTLHFKE